MYICLKLLKSFSLRNSIWKAIRKKCIWIFEFQKGICVDLVQQGAFSIKSLNEKEEKQKAFTS